MKDMLARNEGSVAFISSEAAIRSNRQHDALFDDEVRDAGSQPLAGELTRGTNVRVNSYMPGTTATESVMGYFDGLAKQQGKSVEDALRDFYRDVQPSNLTQKLIDPAMHGPRRGAVDDQHGHERCVSPRRWRNDPVDLRLNAKGEGAMNGKFGVHSLLFSGPLGRGNGSAICRKARDIGFELIEVLMFDLHALGVELTRRAARMQDLASGLAWRLVRIRTFLQTTARLRNAGGQPLAARSKSPPTLARRR